MPTLKKSQPYKLIALDIDGTLLNHKNEISSENRKTIKEAVQNGVHVAISTGRDVFSCKSCVKPTRLSSYLVTANGSEIWDPSGRLIERNPIKHEFIKLMWDLRNKHNTPYWAVTSDNEYREDFPEDVTKHQWLKFGFSPGNREIQEAILTELRKNNQLEISNSSPTNIEVTAFKINKAYGIKKVCEHLNISMDQVMAVGDSLNDLAMIKEVGCGVAMGNAQDLVKESADWITDTNKADGVAKAIRYWILN